MIKNENYFDDESSRRLRELLAGQVLGDLSQEEQQELRECEALNVDVEQELEELELTAAAIQSALSHVTPDASPFPANLKQRLVSQAKGHLASSTDTTSNSGFDAEKHATVADSSRSRVEPVGQTSSKSGISLRESMAWLAFAASLLLAFLLWRTGSVANNALTASSSRAQLLAQASDVIQVAWSNGKHPFDQSVQGDVVWSNQQQSGYMRFVGMPPNDPSVEQYQLWIIDPARDDEPIDGGVFDIPSSGEVVVPINAKLGVIQPAAFAITVEKPGGVVVSTQERLPLLAPVP